MRESGHSTHSPHWPHRWHRLPSFGIYLRPIPLTRCPTHAVPIQSKRQAHLFCSVPAHLDACVDGDTFRVGA